MPIGPETQIVQITISLKSHFAFTEHPVQTTDKPNVMQFIPLQLHRI